jgi:hypothetical protein
MIRVSTGGLRWLALLLVAASAVACDDDPIAPTPPERVSVTETFAGTLAPNDAETFPFSSQSGLVTATLLNLAPDNTVILGLSLGTWNGLTCAVVLANDKATEGVGITGTVNSTGNLCVRVYDVGALVGPLSYEVRVVHF